jgi:hypothetical protein
MRLVQGLIYGRVGDSLKSSLWIDLQQVTFVSTKWTKFKPTFVTSFNEIWR